MKVAVCYSGQIGGIYKAHPNHRDTFLKNNHDIYCYTSNAVSQKGNYNISLPTNSRVYDYLPAGKGWRKNYNNYGIIYNIEEKFIKDTFNKLYGHKLVDYVIENEVIEENNHDLNMTKWEWMKLRQLSKLKGCNELLKKNSKSYDLVVRSRFEFMSGLRMNLESLWNYYAGKKNIENKIFCFGGFKCSPPMVFMDEYFCDGFAFGTPEVMDIFCGLADLEKPYPPNPKYKETWEKWGDSIEHQFRTHMLENNIEICYISNKRSDYQIAR